MREDGWGDVESDDEDESENDEDELETSDGLEDLGGLLLQDSLSSEFATLQGLSLTPPEGCVLEDVPLRDVTPLVPTTALVTNDLRDGQVTRWDGFVEPAFANMSFCQCTSKIKAELEWIESSSEEESGSRMGLTNRTDGSGRGWSWPTCDSGMKKCATRNRARRAEGNHVVCAGDIVSQTGTHTPGAPKGP